jgi:hypothetical protein
MTLTLMQHEADTLLNLEKHYVGEDRFSFPALGSPLRIPLHSEGWVYKVNSANVEFFPYGKKGGQIDVYPQVRRSI